MNKNLAYLRAQKRIKDLRGFYSHLFATFLVLPFLVFVNLELVPQFEWFWFAIGAWAIGLLIHWVVLFQIESLQIASKWEQRKLEEILDQEQVNPADFIKERNFIEAKKKTEEIKGFYWHLIVSCIAVPTVIWVNLQFVPEFEFFWFATAGMLLALLLHWFGLFGMQYFGMGKAWEEKKLEELLNKKI